MQSLDAFIALNRFGLGPAPGEADLVAADPRGWIEAQITPHQVVPPALAAPGTTLTIDCRGKDVAATVVKGKFYQRPH